jgi:hypothetical protein
MVTLRTGNYFDQRARRRVHEPSFGGDTPAVESEVIGLKENSKRKFTVAIPKRSH